MTPTTDARSRPPAVAVPRRTRLFALPEMRWAAAALALFLCGLAVQLLGGPAWLLYFPCYAAGGWQPGLAGLRALREKTLDVDLLMVVAAIGAAAIGQVMDGGLLIVIFATSGALEALATARTEDSVRGLLDLTPDTATRIDSGGAEHPVAATDLAVDDVLLIRPGERIAADSVVLDGTSEVDQATITGEPLPVDKAEGDQVFAGTLNGTGALRVRVERRAADSVVARIAALVEQASRTKARTQLFIEKVERRYSVGMVVATIALFAIPLLWGASVADSLLRAMTFMIVASPCAVVLATMPPLLAAIANAGRRGVLVKSAVVMEQLGAATRVAFDKTGTLTHGIPALAELRLLPGTVQTQLPPTAAPIQLPPDAARSQNPLVADAPPARNPPVAGAAPTRSPLVADASPSRDQLVADASPSRDQLVAEAVLSRGQVSGAAPTESQLLPDAALGVNRRLSDAEWDGDQSLPGVALGEDGSLPVGGRSLSGVGPGEDRPLPDAAQGEDQAQAGGRRIPGAAVSEDQSLPRVVPGADRLLPGAALGADRLLPDAALGGEQSVPGVAPGGDRPLSGGAVPGEDQLPGGVVLSGGQLPGVAPGADRPRPGAELGADQAPGVAWGVDGPLPGVARGADQSLSGGAVPGGDQLPGGVPGVDRRLSGGAQGDDQLLPGAAPGVNGRLSGPAVGVNLRLSGAVVGVNPWLSGAARGENRRLSGAGPAGDHQLPGGAVTGARRVSGEARVGEQPLPDVAVGEDGPLSGAAVGGDESAGTGGRGVSSGDPLLAGGAWDADWLLRLVAGAELPSEHPLAGAVVRAARERGLDIPVAREFLARPGLGVTAVVDGHLVEVGAPGVVAAAVDDLQGSGYTTSVVIVDGEAVGVLALTDQLRVEAADTVAATARLTGGAPILLTGDNLRAAARVAGEVGITDVRAGLLPEGKVAAVRELAAAGERVVVVGDGVNDAPALAAAHAGVAMGGADLAVHAADVVIVRDDLAAVPALIALSARARRVVVANLVIAAVFIAGLVLWDLAGHLPLPLGVAGHEGSTVIVGLNGLRLLRSGSGVRRWAYWAKSLGGGRRSV